MDDDQYKLLFNCIRYDRFPEGYCASSKSKLRSKARRYRIKDNKLWQDDREVIPASRVMEVLNALYNNPETGFVGRDKMYARCVERYSGITKARIASYLTAQQTASTHRRPKAPKVVKPILSSRKYERLELDIIYMRDNVFLNNYYGYILSVIDHYSKYAWCFPLKSRDQKIVIGHIEPILKEHKPSILQTDREFKALTAVCNKYGVKHIMSSGYKPSTNGAVERFNQTLKSMLYKYMANANSKVWINALPQIVENYNSSKHSTTGRRPDAVPNKDKEVTARIKKQAQSWLGPIRKLAVGDRVRTLIRRGNKSKKDIIVEKRYKQNYSLTVYEVVSVSPKGEHRLKNIKTGHTLKTVYHAQELVPAGDVIAPVRMVAKGKHFDREAHLREVASREIEEQE